MSTGKLTHIALELFKIHYCSMLNLKTNAYSQDLCTNLAEPHVYVDESTILS